MKENETGDGKGIARMSTGILTVEGARKGSTICGPVGIIASVMATINISLANMIS